MLEPITIRLMNRDWLGVKVSSNYAIGYPIVDGSQLSSTCLGVVAHWCDIWVVDIQEKTVVGKAKYLKDAVALAVSIERSYVKKNKKEHR